MLHDNKLRFRLSNGSADLAVTDATAVSSDYIDLRAVPALNSGYADGGGALYVDVWMKSVGTLGVGANYTFALQDCDTSGGTYADTPAIKVVARASVVQGLRFRLRFPVGIRRYIKFKVTPAASMTGNSTVNASIVTD